MAKAGWAGPGLGGVRSEQGRGEAEGSRREWEEEKCSLTLHSCSLSPPDSTLQASTSAEPGPALLKRRPACWALPPTRLKTRILPPTFPNKLACVNVHTLRLLWDALTRGTKGERVLYFGVLKFSSVPRDWVVRRATGKSPKASISLALAERWVGKAPLPPTFSCSEFMGIAFQVHFLPDP